MVLVRVIWGWEEGGGEMVERRERPERVWRARGEGE